jgi:hypothetical protein
MYIRRSFRLENPSVRDTATTGAEKIREAHTHLFAADAGMHDLAQGLIVKSRRGRLGDDPGRRAGWIRHFHLG